MRYFLLFGLVTGVLLTEILIPLIQGSNLCPTFAALFS